MYKCVHGFAPKVLSAMIVMASDIKQLRLDDDDNDDDDDHHHGDGNTNNK